MLEWPAVRGRSRGAPRTAQTRDIALDLSERPSRSPRCPHDPRPRAPFDWAVRPASRRAPGFPSLSYIVPSTRTEYQVPSTRYSGRYASASMAPRGQPTGLGTKYQVLQSGWQILSTSYSNSYSNSYSVQSTEYLPARLKYFVLCTRLQAASGGVDRWPSLGISYPVPSTHTEYQVPSTLSCIHYHRCPPRRRAGPCARRSRVARSAAYEAWDDRLPWSPGHATTQSRSGLP